MEWIEGLGGPFRIDTTSWWVAIGSAALIGFLLGALPAGAAEAIALAAGAIPSPRLRAAVLVAFTAGHVGGKMLWYALGRLGSRITQPSLRRWIDRAKTLTEQHPTLGLGVVATSASVSCRRFTSWRSPPASCARPSSRSFSSPLPGGSSDSACFRHSPLCSATSSRSACPHGYRSVRSRNAIINCRRAIVPGVEKACGSASKI